MNRLYKNLLSLLVQKLALYKEFVLLLQKEWEVVAEYSLSSLEDIVKKKETLVLKMQMLEENRTRVIAGLAPLLGIPEEELTLKKLIESNDHPDNKLLSRYRKELKEEIEHVARWNEKNMNLINHSSTSLKKSIAFICKKGEEAINGSYYSNGQNSEIRLSSQLLSTNA